MESNSRRFLKAYNDLDHSLRTIFNLKRSMSFSDVVRRCVPLNSVIRKYEEDLIDYGRLRNAIVHSSNQTIIAEPHIEAVEKLEHIAELVCTPPKVINSFCKREVVCVDSQTSVSDVIALIYKTGYSNLPVYKNNALIGVANNGKILNFLGEVCYKKQNLVEFCENTPIEKIVYEAENYFLVKSSDLTLEQALNEFYKNRKLLVILITKNGLLTERPIGVVSTGDILDINNILENF